VSLVIAVPTALAVLHTKLLIPIIAFFKRALGCLTRVEKYMGVLDSIAYEFQPNGGNSLKDALNRLELFTAVSNTKIQTIMDYHGMAAWESDKAGACIWASEELLKLMELNHHEMQGFGWMTAIAEEDRQRVSSEWTRAVEQQRQFHMEYQVGIENFTKVLGRATQIRDSKGQLTGFIGTLKPI
jgi:PAS domain-containing protein